MNALLLTVLALSGINGAAAHGGPGAVYDEGAYGDCEACGGHGHGLLGHHGRHGHHAHCWGPMPQTCYDPPYGCYPGTRSMHRYPAFHGTYYRRPYNYRNVFDYPWHADLHEPTSHFSYNVSGETGNGQAQPEAPVPVPTPAAAAPIPLHEQIERVTIGSPGKAAPRGIPTLRR